VKGDRVSEGCGCEGRREAELMVKGGVVKSGGVMCEGRRAR
jgi:hypothetical protein